MRQGQVEEVVRLHEMWLKNPLEGKKADLSGANNIFLFNKQGGRTCYAVVHDTCLMVLAGCFWGTLDEFMAKAFKETAGYEAQIVYLQALTKQIYGI
jgi:hypothetical protein